MALFSPFCTGGGVQKAYIILGCGVESGQWHWARLSSGCIFLARPPACLLVTAWHGTCVMMLILARRQCAIGDSVQYEQDYHHTLTKFMFVWLTLRTFFLLPQLRLIEAPRSPAISRANAADNLLQAVLPMIPDHHKLLEAVFQSIGADIFGITIVHTPIHTLKTRPHCTPQSAPSLSFWSSAIHPRDRAWSRSNALTKAVGQPAQLEQVVELPQARDGLEKALPV